MKSLDLKFHAARVDYSNRIELRVGYLAGDTDQVAKPLEFVALPDGYYSEPALRLTNEEAQRLMDELWNVGLRPTEGSGSAGALAATQRHLEDMRRLVFQTTASGGPVHLGDIR